MRELNRETERLRTDLMRARMLEAAWNADRSRVQTIACSLIGAKLQCSAAELLDTAENLASDSEH